MANQNSILRVLGTFLAKSIHGEGAHGGHIVGHTRSGKPIYRSMDGGDARYKHFTKEDHEDAMAGHEGVARVHQAASMAATKVSNESSDPMHQQVAWGERGHHSSQREHHDNIAASHFAASAKM